MQHAHSARAAERRRYLDSLRACERHNPLAKERMAREGGAGEERDKDARLEVRVADDEHACGAEAFQ